MKTHKERAQRHRKKKQKGKAIRIRGESEKKEHADVDRDGTGKRQRERQDRISEPQWSKQASEQTENSGGETTIKTPKEGKGIAGQVKSSARNFATNEEARTGEATKRTPRKVARTRPSLQCLYHGQGVGCQGAGTDGTHQDWYENLACVCANLDYDRLGPSVCDP